MKGTKTVETDGIEVEWATEPLLDQDNVGKYVWFSFNSNKPITIKIEKIGRSVIHFGHNSYAGWDGKSFQSYRNGYGMRCWSNAEQLLINKRRHARSLVSGFGLFNDWTHERLDKFIALFEEVK